MDDPVRTKLTDEEVAAVLAGHEAMVWWIAGKVAGRIGPDAVEEMAAEVRLRFVKAARLFDPSRGRTFATYAMRLATIYAARKRREDGYRGVHVPAYLKAEDVELPAVVSLSTPVGGDDGGGNTVGDLEAVAPEPEERPEFPPDFWDRVSTRLQPKQRQALELRYRHGLTLDAAGERMGLSKERVRQLCNRAMERMAGDPEVRKMAAAALEGQ